MHHSKKGLWASRDHGACGGGWVSVTAETPIQPLTLAAAIKIAHALRQQEATHRRKGAQHGTG